MAEFLNATFSYVNIIPTGFLIFTLIYWLSVLIGMLDMNFLDFNIDKDVDINADADISIDKELSVDKDININKDVDINKELDSDMDISWLNAVLSFFNLGKVPFMVFLTFWALPMWFISVVGNYYLGVERVLISLLLLIPNFFLSLFVSKLLTQPLVGIFSRLDADEKDDLFEAKIGEALTSISSDKPGQVEIQNKGVNIRINAISVKGKEIMRGSKIVVIQLLKEKELYLVDEFNDI